MRTFSSYIYKKKRTCADPEGGREPGLRLKKKHKNKGFPSNTGPDP